MEGDDVLVKADKKSLADVRRAPIPCGSKADEDSRSFVIVGGGGCIISKYTVSMQWFGVSAMQGQPLLNALRHCEKRVSKVASQS